MSLRLEIEHDERDEGQDEPRRGGKGVRAAVLALVVTGLVGGSGGRDTEVRRRYKM